jgi:aspartyl-tRNA(Asn)/glutamyl-tRNA(Gln) amidotransferase subunit C
VNVKEVSRLARLQLSGQEEHEIQKQLDQILQYFEELDKVNTKGVDPMVTPIELVHELREDCVEAWDKHEEVLTEAPQTMGHLFKVPPVV